MGVELVLPNIKSSTTLLTKNTMADWMTMTKRLGMEKITGIINFLSLLTSSCLMLRRTVQLYVI